jgi:hypothetical protein
VSTPAVFEPEREGLYRMGDMPDGDGERADLAAARQQRCVGGPDTAQRHCCVSIPIKGYC